ncbi:MAG: hypothetical protein ACK5JI_10130, partial [Azonexus sp.]
PRQAFPEKYFPSRNPSNHQKPRQSKEAAHSTQQKKSVKWVKEKFQKKFCIAIARSLSTHGTASPTTIEKGGQLAALV